MLKILAAVLLVLVFLPPVLAAFADHEWAEANSNATVPDVVVQTEPIGLGTVVGPDEPRSGPYVEQRLDNMDR